MPIHFAEAIPIACLGLAVNVASAWLLGGGDRHGHGHAHSHGHGRADTYDPITKFLRLIVGRDGEAVLDVYEDGVPPRFRLEAQSGPELSAATWVR